MYLKLKDIHNDEREVNDAFIKKQKTKTSKLRTKSRFYEQ
ncbi:hypothetical protein bcere0017_56610 [Bacillus cereus Rock1-3]|nr:hypothetical protein bcere0017_56610 [Bacillus cereus Rock1-3]